MQLVYFGTNKTSLYVLNGVVETVIALIEDSLVILKLG